MTSLFAQRGDDGAGRDSALTDNPLPTELEPDDLRAVALLHRHLEPEPDHGSWQHDRTAEFGCLPISTLLKADSPRLSGEDAEHVHMLAASTTELPPILVHRATRRVIDGMHRLRAAELLGHDSVRVRYFDGEDEEAFVLAVIANVKHGLPLSFAERQAAAQRIIRAYPEWSDRALAAVTGLSAKVVALTRGCATADPPQLHSRIGKDGRRRPVDGAVGRQRASELFSLRPDASLREVAREAGISPGTARDVRNRMRCGEDPIPAKQRRGRPWPIPAGQEQLMRREAAAQRVGSACDRETIIANLRRDPSIRFTDSGRTLLRWIDVRAGATDGWRSVLLAVPPHCAYMIADLACVIADQWLDIADQLRRRAENTA